MTAEMAARRTAAAALLADFYREANAFGVDGALAYRVAAELRSLLKELDRPRPRVDGSQSVTWVGVDGTATLAHDDRLTVLGALSAAAVSDPGHAVAYRAVAIRLGDDR